jgi:hypothetical protein
MDYRGTWDIHVQENDDGTVSTSTPWRYNPDIGLSTAAYPLGVRAQEEALRAELTARWRKLTGK